MNNWKRYAFADEADRTLTGQIEAMKRNGLDGVELRDVDGVNVSDLTAAQAKEIRARLEAEGLKVWALGSPIGKIDIVRDDYAKHLDRFRNTMEVAHQLGTANIRMFSFYIPAGDDPAVYRTQVLDRLSEMAEMAQGNGVVLCHENEKGIYGDNAVRCADVLAAVPSLAGVFDPANFIQCGQDTTEAWQLLKNRIKYLHIKDALPDGRVVPVGMGIGNVSAILREYAEMGGTVLTVEPHLFDFVGLSSLEREGEKSLVGGLRFATPGEAFDAACQALQRLL